MTQSFGSSADTLLQDLLRLPAETETITVEPVPAGHPAEPELFSRHEGIPGHDQAALASARIFLVGAGGLNSWTAMVLARSGARSLVIADPDLVDRTNLSRQLYFPGDLGHPKGLRLARNLAAHAVGGASITGIPLSFEDAIEHLTLPADLFVVGVDNNNCRLSCAQEARRRRVPAVFTMLSRDGMRCQSFLQGASNTDPCLWCGLPNLDPESNSPCASAIASTCALAASFAATFAYRALMGWPQNVPRFNWLDLDLLGIAPFTRGNISRQPQCPVCRGL